MRPLLHLLFSVFLLGATSLHAQSELENIFQSSNKFDEIVRNAENYFRAKHPDVSFDDLTHGEHRDGKFVKFMRWKSYWENSLNSDGTLGDPTAYFKSQAGPLKNSSSPYSNVNWTNLSYNNYITSQIGLGRTTSMAFHPTNPNIWYVGAAIGGIWRTTNGGQSYTPLGDDLPFLAVSSIVVDQNNPNTIYIAVSDHVWYGPPSIGVYKSTNGGSTWSPTALSFDFTDNVRIYRMEAVPGNPNKIFVATADGIYRTTNGFASVSKVSNLNTYDVRIHPSNSNIVYAGGNNGEFYRSTNGGNSFSYVRDFGNGSVFLAVTPLNSSKVYARNGSTLHKSFNNGASFTSTSTFNDQNSNDVFIFSPTNDNVILAGNFEIHRSNNGGSSWSTITNWLGNSGLPLIHVDQRNIYVNPLQNNFVYFCNDGGIYRYRISENRFDNLCDGLQITQFYDIAVSQTNSNIIGGGSQDNGNVYRSSNGTWDDYAPTGDGMNQEIDSTNSNIRYWAYQNGSIHRWQSGNSVNISPNGQSGQGAWETPYKLAPSNANIIVAGYDRIYRSTNRGDSWTAISGILNGGTDMGEIAIAPTNQNRIYASSGNRLYVKSATSNTWTTRTLPGPRISDLEVSPTTPNTVYVTVPGYTNGSKVYRSTDSGANWTNISGSLPNVSTDAIETYNNAPGGLFVGTDAGVYYRDDNHTDWVEYGQLPHTRVDDIEIQYSAGLVRVGTHGRGVLQAPINIQSCYPAPTATVSHVDEVCGVNGSITFTFADTPSRTNIEFSFTGQNGSYTTVPDNSGSYTRSNLAPGTYNLWVRWGDDTCPEDLGSVTIDAQDVITNYGTISGNQSACGSYNPGNISGTPVGTTGSAINFLYRWEKRTTGGWSEISGATGQSYNPGPIAETTEYRRRAYNNNGCGNQTTNVVTKTVIAAPTVAVSSTDEICGVNGSITFTFPNRADRGSIEFSFTGQNGPYTTVPDNSGSYTRSDLAPGIYDLWTRWGDDTCPVSLGSVTINAQDVITNYGSISGNQSRCGSYNPGNISGTPVTTTGPAINVTYRWERRTTGGWSTISGATGQNYNPGTITQTTQYRRRAYNNNDCGNDVTNVVTKTVLGSDACVQAGTVSISTANSGDWDQVTFATPFSTTPIVTAGPPGYAGSNQSSFRIRNISTTGFQIQIDEWDYWDGGHTAEEISYLAAAPGTYNLGGVTLRAGAVTNVNHEWTTINYGATVNNPVVLAAQVTNSGGACTTVRTDNVTASSCQIRLQEEEAADDIHANETVHYMVLSTGTGSLNGQPLRVNLTTNSVTHAWKTLNYGGTYQTPHFVANMQTYDGSDPATLRFRNKGNTSVQVFAEEEQSADDEIAHTTEVVGYVVIEQNVSALTQMESGNNAVDGIFATEDQDKTQEHKASSIKIYPVPVRDQLHLIFNREQEFTRLQIVNIHGLPVLPQQAIQHDRMSIDTRTLPPGLYMIRLFSERDKGIVSRKFIVQ